jgi:hypothetical protein
MQVRHRTRHRSTPAAGSPGHDDPPGRLATILASIGVASTAALAVAVLGVILVGGLLLAALVVALVGMAAVLA